MVDTLVTDGSTVWVGGEFEHVGGVLRSYLAAISAPPVGVPARDERTSSLALRVAPTPAHATASIRFSLPHAAHVTLAIYDVNGRRVAAMLENAPRSAGEHSIEVDTRSWNSGLVPLFCRLEAAGVTSIQRLPVLH